MINKHLLDNKTILLIAPFYYGYQKQIFGKLKEFGANVIMFPELKFNVIYSIFLRCPKRLFFLYQNMHYDIIINRIKNISVIDYLFVIKGHKMPDTFVDKIKCFHPNITTIMYQWDSQERYPYIHLKNKFDKIFTFDYDDSRQYGITYLPLFFSDDIYTVRTDVKIKKKHDYFLLATYSHERYSILLKLLEKNSHCKFKAILYIPIRMFVKEILKGEKINLKLISLRIIKRKSFLKYLTESCCIVDITYTDQSGLPMRVIEAAGALLPILSTNKNIANEFQNKIPVAIIDTDSNFNDLRYLMSDKINISLIDNYSLTSWIEKIFIENR
jgi:hypothetical protein